MSKINQIQNELRSLGDAEFQKLADLYLHKKGYEQINPIGSVIGSDKVRKGTPDTLITLLNGKYIFAEHTTQKEGVFKKLEEDLKKCFDAQKTGISVSKIEEVVFCHTSLLSPNEEESLREECRKRGINVNIFGLGPISFDLYQKYPEIAREYLSIEVDTGQIVTSEEFVTKYNKSAIVTPLNTTFHFREPELEQVLQGLENNNLAIISGKAGIGKSRFVLEICDQFKASHPEYEIRCIFFRGANLFEDLRVHFSEPKKYLIFVDDANRISQFEYFIRLLLDQREDQQIKVIATVRDYALEKVLEAAKPYGELVNVELTSLNDEQVKHLVRDEYGITNHRYLNRISDISQGNPRLAVMASEVAKQENRLTSLVDVSSLYDKYYSSIRHELEELGDTSDLLKITGIVAFFRVVDYSNEEMITAIEQAFGISKDIFWQAVGRLHNLEILDMYENEIARTSDQVLATYLFYQAFFVKRVLSFSALLENFFPRLQHRLIDALNPVLNTFDSQKVTEVIRPQVEQAWKAYKNAGNEMSLMHLMEVFWFVKETPILLYVRDYISEMEAEIVDLSTLEIKPNSHLSSPSILTILGVFINSNESNFRIALNLLAGYLIKRPKDLPEVLYLLTDRFGFDHDSYAHGFVMQRAVIDVLWEQTQEGSDELFSKLFLAVAKKYLRTHFSTTSIKNRRLLNILNFDLPPTDELLQLREKIWKGIFNLYEFPIFKDTVLDLLHEYSKPGYHSNSNKVIQQDSKKILSFIKSKIDPSSYTKCLIVQDYLAYLKIQKISFNQKLSTHFTNEAFIISKILIFDYPARRYSKLSFDQYENLKQQHIVNHFLNYSFSDYKQFFEHCLEIQRDTNRRNHNAFHFPSRIVEVLIALAQRDAALYINVMQHYFSLGNPCHLDDLRLVDRLIQICGVEKSYVLLNEFDYPAKRKWLYDFHRLLPQEKITPEYLDQLYCLYRETSPNEIPEGLDFLLKYGQVDELAIVQITRILLNRSTNGCSKFTRILSSLFNEFTDINKNLFDLFKNNLIVLKEAYFITSNAEIDVDYDRHTFSKILDIDPGFIIEHINWVQDKKDESLITRDDCSYSFIWKRKDYKKTINRIIQYVCEQRKKQIYFFSSGITKLFILEADEKHVEILRKRQDSFLRNIIKNKCRDIYFLRFIFRKIIMQFSFERRRNFIAFFLGLNKNFEDFEKIPLESSSLSWEGSAVPMYQKIVEYFESLLPLLNNVDLLQHRQYIEEYIQCYREKVEQEKKKDFVEA